MLSLAIQHLFLIWIKLLWANCRSKIMQHLNEAVSWKPNLTNQKCHEIQKSNSSRYANNGNHSIAWFSFQWQTNISLFFSNRDEERMRNEYIKFIQYLLHSEQVFRYDEEHPYASPTTHLDAVLISEYHLSQRSENSIGRGCPKRLAHLGDIASKLSSCLFLETRRCFWDIYVHCKKCY